MVKLIWQNIPKIFKKLLIPSSIIFALIGSAAYQYITDGKLKYSETALYNFILVLMIYLLTLIILSILISYSRIIFDSYQKILQFNLSTLHSTSNKNLEIKKKKLPNKFELEIINYNSKMIYHNLIEYTVFIWRKWLPSEQKPGIEEFLSAIDLSEERCGKCHSNFYIEYRTYNSYTCINPKCDNNEEMIESNLFRHRSMVFSQYKGTVRNDYSKYWEMYKKIYDSYTNKDYNKYESPI